MNTTETTETTEPSGPEHARKVKNDFLARMTGYYWMLNLMNGYRRSKHRSMKKAPCKVAAEKKAKRKMVKASRRRNRA